jgi:hypothetical protein
MHSCLRPGVDRAAAWHTGPVLLAGAQRGSMPGSGLAEKTKSGVPPEKVGSGKDGTPLVRMHAAHLSSACCWAAVSGWETPPLPPGSRDRQACSAACTCGEFMSIPAPDTVTFPFGPVAGSGKFFTPWARMHAE